MALTRSITPILPVHAEIVEAAEEASLNIKKGAAVADADRDGLIAELGDDDADLLGFLLHDSKNNSTAGDGKSLVALAMAASLFSGTLEDDANGDHVLVASDILAEFGLAKDSTSSIWILDENEKDGADSRVRVIRALDALGDTRARVLFTPTHDAVEFNDT